MLTAPLAGTEFGLVVNNTLQPIGSSQFFVDAALEDIEEYAIYVQTDGQDAAGPGTLVLTGRPTRPTRGVRHVHLTSPDSNLTAEMAIFADLGEDDVQF